MFSRNRPSSNSRRATRKPHALPHSRLGVEPLEDRRMMAGDLLAQLQFGGLFLSERSGSTGLAQGIEVTQEGDRLIVKGRVQGGSLTRINGQRTFEIPLPTSLNINLGGGNDVALIRNVNLQFGLGVNTAAPANFSGSDNDYVEVSNVSVGAGMNIITGAGSDAVGVVNARVGADLNVFASDAKAVAASDADTVGMTRSVVRGKTHLETGVGADIVLVQSSTLGDAAADSTEIFTGAGADNVFVGSLSFEVGEGVLVTGNLDIRTLASLNSISDKDVDKVSVRDTTVRENLYAKLGSGNDQVEMENVTAFKTMLLEGQGDNDTMKLTDVEAADGFFALMGDGNDVLDITGLRARRMSVVGGSGFDQLFKFDVSNIPADSTSITGFEQINGIPQLIKRGVSASPVATRV